MYVWIRHSAGYCDIPRKGLAAAPWNKSATIWPFTISTNQTRWFFTGGIPAAPRAWTMQSFNAWCLAARPGASANQTMYPWRVDISATAISVRAARVNAKTQSHSVIFVNENENENGEKRENNEFVNEN